MASLMCSCDLSPFLVKTATSTALMCYAGVMDKKKLFVLSLYGGPAALVSVLRKLPASC